MGIETIKIVLTICIWGLGLFSVVAPRYLAARPAMFSIGNMMASGVLLSAGLVHQLGDSSQVLDVPGKFPWAMFLAGLTLLAFFVLEESIHLLFGEGGGGHGHDHALNLHEMMHSHDHPHQEQQDEFIEELDHHEHAHAHNNHNHNNKFLPESYRNGSLSSSSAKVEVVSELDRLLPPPPLEFGTEYRRLSASCCSVSNHIMNVNSSNGDQHTTSSTTRMTRFSSAASSDASYSLLDPQDLQLPPPQHHHHDEHIELHLHGSIVASGILMLALSIHAILAGVSIGIETNIQALTSTAIAILAHKSFEGFCLGSSLVTAQLDTTLNIVLCIVFSFATPLGVIMGHVLSDISQGETTIAIVQAIVAGTFLYVAIVEIASKELLACRHESGNTMSQKQIEATKLGSFLLGFLFMSSLAVFV